MTDAADVVIVGSGINSLVCAALLAKRGKRVLVLEREAVAGGCIRTEALTAPGFLHDTLSTLYPLFVTAPHFATLAPDLAAAGVRFRNADAPTAVLLPDGRALVLTRDRTANAAALDRLAPGDGASHLRAMRDVERDGALVFGLLGQPVLSWSTVRLLAGQVRTRGWRGLVGFLGQALAHARGWLEHDFASDLARALYAPWVLHVGLGPESSMSALMNRLVLFTLEQAGSPMVEGGGVRLVEGLTRIVERHGGEVRCGVDADAVIVERGRARGVRLADGTWIAARQAVVANVTPPQLYTRLLRDVPGLQGEREAAAAFRFGRGEMQIHLALSEPPAWPDPALAKVGMLHLTPGLDGVSRAVNEAERGLLPAEATIVVAQPIAIDPSRAAPGGWIFWIQLQELPRDGALRGDALNEIGVPADGRWTAEVRDAYADRIVARLARQIPNLRASIVGQHVIGPGDLAALNINLVEGDPYSGSCELDQFMLWRPGRTGRAHRTPIPALHHIGASTHPGPGLGGMSGAIVARALR